jgi:hypothetical protein
MKLHKFKINELERDNGRAKFWHYTRRFWHWYSNDEKDLFEAHLETIVKKKTESYFDIALRINPDSESVWSGNFRIFGAGFFWGHSGFRRLAERIVKCDGYKYDDRNWSLRISDGSLWWVFAEHNDMCNKHNRRAEDMKKSWPKRRNFWRRGVINLSIPEAIWGPKRYSYEDVDSFATVIKMPEGEYGVLLKLQRVFLGRTKVARHKHIQSWTIEVDAPKGIPTHYDHSGGWKGDRTYGFGVPFKYPRSEGWQQDAEAAVTAAVYKYRSDSGFREPQETE